MYICIYIYIYICSNALGNVKKDNKHMVIRNDRILKKLEEYDARKQMGNFTTRTVLNEIGLILMLGL